MNLIIKKNISGVTKFVPHLPGPQILHPTDQHDRIPSTRRQICVRLHKLWNRVPARNSKT